MHHVIVISIRLIELYHAEFWVTTSRQALIAEVPINFEYLFKSTNNHTL